ncbi:MAG: hypothetical protein K5990_00895 [Oscillospiraceae bacterium]|nr:hypothetical protein [Oscillospiraceae bacterium]
MNDAQSRDGRDDLYFTASLLEFTARTTHNHIGDVARRIGVAGIESVYRFAPVSHCLSFEENRDELVARYAIADGGFQVLDTKPKGITPPRFLSIGRSYANLAAALEPDPGRYPRALYDLLCSEFSLRMEDYRSALFYSPMDYQMLVYQALPAAQHTERDM